MRKESLFAVQPCIPIPIPIPIPILIFIVKASEEGVRFKFFLQTKDR